MKKLLLWCVLPPVAIIMVAFAIANRHATEVSFDPLPFAIDVPLYGAVFAAIFLGLVAGGLMTWLGQGKWRRLARQQQRESRRLLGEVDGLRADAANDVATNDVAAGEAPASKSLALRG